MVVVCTSVELPRCLILYFSYLIRLCYILRFNSLLYVYYIAKKSNPHAFVSPECSCWGCNCDCHTLSLHVDVSKLQVLNRFYERCSIFCMFNPDTSGSNHQLLLSLNKDLLRSLEEREGLPNPSVHLALRLSELHNLLKEGEHLNRLTSHLHNDIQR